MTGPLLSRSQRNLGDGDGDGNAPLRSRTRHVASSFRANTLGTHAPLSYERLGWSKLFSRVERASGS
jgi:hypothetical protein